MYRGFVPGQVAVGRERGPRIKIQILSVQLDQNDVSIEFERVHDSRVEEVLVPGGDFHRRRIEPGGTRQRQKQPGNFVAAAVAPLPYVLDVIDVLELFSRLLLFGFIALKRQVANLLGTRVYLLQFDFRIIGGGNDIAQRINHGPILVGKVFHLAVFSFAFLLPELVGVFFQIPGVGEFHPEFHLVLGWHVVFGLKRWHVLGFEADHVVVVFGRIGTRWQTQRPTPYQSKI